MNKKEILKDLVYEFQKTPFPSFIPRSISYKIIPGKALSLIGMRRTGKSTFLYQIMRDLLTDKETIREDLVLVNFVDERLDPFTSHELHLIEDAFNELYPDRNPARITHYFFDEIQNVEGWEPFVERLLRNKKNRVYLTGSSSKMLSTEIATSMRGRNLAYEIFPFSFREKANQCYPNITYFDSKIRIKLNKIFRDFLFRGGFPEVQNMDSQTLTRILQEYYHTVLYRDIIERHNSSSPKTVSSIMHLLCTQPSRLYTINKTANRLQSLGMPAYKTGISEVIDWMQDAYLFYSVPLYAESIAKQNTNPKKAYLIDSGLAASLNMGLSHNTGALLENTIFSELRRQTSKIFYYKTKKGHEIDFIASLEKKSNHADLIQVCDDISEKETLERETRALFEGMNELKRSKSYLIIREGEEKEITQERKKIIIKKAWRFLMEDVTG